MIIQRTTIGGFSITGPSAGIQVTLQSFSMITERSDIRRLLSSGLQHGATTQKTVFFILAAVRTSNPI
jgi:hypothetical protein